MLSSGFRESKNISLAKAPSTLRILLILQERLQPRIARKLKRMFAAKAAPARTPQRLNNQFSLRAWRLGQIQLYRDSGLQ
jgi:hypothetical protein